MIPNRQGEIANGRLTRRFSVSPDSAHGSALMLSVPCGGLKVIDKVCPATTCAGRVTRYPGAVLVSSSLRDPAGTSIRWSRCYRGAFRFPR